MATDLSEEAKAWLEKMSGVLFGAPVNVAANTGSRASAGSPIVQSVAAGATPNLHQAARDYAENTEKLPPPPPPEKQPSPELSFPASESPITDEGGRLSSDAVYDQLPDKLKEKLSQQFWSGLEARQRRTLLETYRRLKSYGLWGEVKRVTGEKAKPEPHVAIGGFEFEVDGNSGGLTYEAHNGSKFVKKLQATGKFGLDGIEGALHGNQKSLREWRKNEGPRAPTSLHISVGPGNHFDAHIDKVSPVNKPVDGKTRLNQEGSKKHWEDEVIPEKVRDVTKLPLKPTVKVKPKKDGGVEVIGGVEVELRWPVEKTKEPLVPKPSVPNPAPEKVQVKIANRVAGAVKRFPISVGTTPGDEPVPKAVASQMAAIMLEAIRNGETRIKMDLAYYRDKHRDQPEVIEAMEKIGRIVRSELLPQADPVTTLTVTFGSNSNQGGTVMIAD